MLLDMPRVRKVGFVLIGGEHQFMHVLPVAAALSRRPCLQVRLFAVDAVDAAAAAAMLAVLGAPSTEIVTLRLPGPLSHLVDSGWGRHPAKVLRLFFWAREMRRCDLLVLAERTSTLLKTLPGRCPTLVHIPHGAGDRIRSFDQRVRRFDHVIAPGPKYRDRLLAAGLVALDHCDVSGYIKYSALLHLGRLQRLRLFANGRPTVLYNAHFKPGKSSWHDHARRVIEAIAEDGRFNLIVAPHVRLFKTAGRRTRSKWEALSSPDRVLVDLGSERSLDMTYARAADLYLGDVSSQVYEFLAEPRPCVFLNSHRVRWQGNPEYRMWTFGEVIESPDALIAALERAPARHADYLQVQTAAVREAFGDFHADCAAAAADIIERLMPPAQAAVPHSMP